MPLPLSPIQARTLTDALLSPETVASRSRYRLEIGGESFSRQRKAHSYEMSEGPAMTCEVTLACELSEEYEGEELNLWQVIGGVSFLVFTGDVMVVDVDRGYTQVSAATTGTHLESTKIPYSLATGKDRILEYTEADPRYALYEALSPLYRDRMDLDVRVPQKFTRELDEGFSWTQTMSDVVSAVEEDTGLKVYDSGHGVLRGFVEETLIRDRDAVISLKAGAHRDFVDLVDYRYATRYRERYTRVRVFYTPSEGAQQGVDVLLGEAQIDAPGLPERCLDIQTEDSDQGRAQERANREAFLHSTDTRVFEATLLYTLPHFEKTDVLEVVEVKRGERRGVPGRWTLRHVLRLMAFSSDETKRMTLSGVQRTISETFRADGVARARGSGTAFASLWGLDYAGRQFTDTALDWQTTGPGYVEYDTEAAALAGVTVTKEGSAVVVSDGSES